MYYDTLLFVHLATILPSIFIGTYLMIFRKGTPLHRKLGKVYLLLMLKTGIATAIMPSMGPKLFNHFGFFHIFSALTLWTVPNTWNALKRKDIRAHKFGMVGLYIGGIVIATIVAFLPGRTMYNFFFG